MKQIANYSTYVTVLASITYHCTMPLEFSIAAAVNFDMEAFDKDARAQRQGDMEEFQRLLEFVEANEPENTRVEVCRIMATQGLGSWLPRV